ncbi:MAG: hypothetical protein U5Q16_07090 [Gammaproteobacteria bacterium]|nr:hypothetical protein [Gammaproteobacteria bacterium]
MPDDTIHIKFHGSAGQSFGAWLRPRRDHRAGKATPTTTSARASPAASVIVYPPRRRDLRARGQHHRRQRRALRRHRRRGLLPAAAAGERFCVRNSGATAVVEGVGDHGCEYMTGGRVVILGPTGRNFAAGMSGGIAYVWDPHALFPDRCNMEMVELEELVISEEIEEVRRLIARHAEFTGSTVAQALLSNWERAAAAVRRSHAHRLQARAGAASQNAPSAGRLAPGTTTE